MIDEAKLQKIKQEIAELQFRSIDINAPYLIILPGVADEFNNTRLMSGLPTNLIGHKDSAIGVPLRDHGIYKLTPDGEGHMEIADGWGDHLVEKGVAQKLIGGDITLAHIENWADLQVRAFIASLPDLSNAAPAAEA